MNMRDKIAQTLAYKVAPYELRMWADLLPETREEYCNEADAILASLDPDALVRAALERAAGEADKAGQIFSRDVIRALADDPEAIAAIKAKAGWKL